METLHQQPTDDRADLLNELPDQDSPLERMIAGSPPMVRKIISTLRFEVQRTKTYSRRAVWLTLALFPVAIMIFFRANADIDNRRIWAFVFYLLIPQAVCILGLLLWISPVLSNELESRTWVYLAVRPGGKVAVLLGKYLNGVCWTASAALMGLGLSIAVVTGQLRGPFEEPLVLGLALALLILASCLAYGSLYLLLGVLFPRRAMVVCVAYTLVVEVLVSIIPAIVNQLTVQHRLFNLLFKTLDLEIDGLPFQLDSSPVWLHLAALVGYTLLNLSVAAFVLQHREYSTSEQS